MSWIATIVFNSDSKLCEDEVHHELHQDGPADDPLHDQPPVWYPLTGLQGQDIPNYTSLSKYFWIAPPLTIMNYEYGFAIKGRA